MLDAKYARRAYVIMPFSDTVTQTASQWTEIYEDVFKPAVVACGYACDRAQSTNGHLFSSIVKDLAYSRLVIADLTDRNANVLYELGVRHSLSKRTIIVAQKPEDVPSDLKGLWVLPYKTNPAAVSAFAREIKRHAEDIDKEPEKSDSDVSKFLEQERAGIRNYSFVDNVKRVSALLTELTAITNVLNEVGNNSEFRSLLDYGCIDLLLNTLYVDVGKPTLMSLLQLRLNLKRIRFGIARGGDVLTESVGLSKSLFSTILTLKQELISGTFIEPSELSTIAWASVARNDDGAISKPEDFSAIDLDDLKRFGRIEDK